MNKQQLAAKIWESANKMRSKIEANEYKDYILGFIFYKFLSDKEEKYLLELGYERDEFNTVTEEDEETVRNIQQNIGYFIGFENLFSTWLSMGSDFSVQNVHDALHAFSRLINPTHKKVFDKIFETLQTGLSKLGEGAGSQTKAISDLIQLIRDIPMDDKQDYDVLGFIYEYLISNFAANAGKKAGEFYTPHEVSMLMAEIISDHLHEKKEIKVYDPTSGSGSLLINIGQAAAKHMGNTGQIKYYAQEWKENTYNLTRMNLIMRGIIPDNIEVRNGDTLEEDWPYFEENDPVGTYEPLYVDAVVSNPPYSQNWNPADKESDPRYSGFGLAPKSKADYAFLLHDLFHVKSDGVMTIVLPHGVLFRGGEEGEIRKNLIEKNHIDAVIGLPANIFFGTGIPTIIMVLKKRRVNTDVLIIDASRGFEKSGKNNKLRASDIKRITDVVKGRLDVPKFSRVVSREEIRDNDYNLNIPRYVDSSEKPESWDIYATMFGGVPQAEIDELEDYWRAFPGLRDELFTRVNESYCDLKTDDIKKAVAENPGVVAFSDNYTAAFEGFDSYLYEKLVDGIDTMIISKGEETISGEIFGRLENIPLVDAYDAYQILDDEWSRISVDLEILQTEGIAAAKQVDPNMVMKKVKGRDQEVRDGWIGHVIPFELVQKKLLSEETVNLERDETALADTMATYDELLESLPEEEREKGFVNDDKSAFVWAEVKKSIKNKDVDEDVLKILLTASKTNNFEKTLKKNIKEKTAALHEKTKEVIEGLSDSDVKGLLLEKWITPLISELMTLPNRLINELTTRLENIVGKYRTTFEDVEYEILKTERELSAMLGDLRGNEFDMKGIDELRRIMNCE